MSGQTQYSAINSFYSSTSLSLGGAGYLIPNLLSIKNNPSVKNDERIYSFARNLRKYRLDELPQIINIFLGHMHLVGPRAEWVKLSDMYSKNIDNYELRNIVRPGITGWAQVLYQYGFDVDDSKQKLMYELYYIKNWTIWLELEICIKTITVILDKKGF